MSMIEKGAKGNTADPANYFPWAPYTGCSDKDLEGPTSSMNDGDTANETPCLEN